MVLPGNLGQPWHQEVIVCVIDTNFFYFFYGLPHLSHMDITNGKAPESIFRNKLTVL